METLRKVELTVASWYEGAPHLPENGRKWLAVNLWWLTLIGVVLGVIGASTLLMALFAGAAILTLSGNLTVATGGTLAYAAFITLTFAVANIVLMAVAIAPLKALRKPGWTLLFATVLVNVLSLVVSFVFYYNLMSLLWGLVFAAVGAYFLFEVRGFYEVAPTKGKTAKKPASS